MHICFLFIQSDDLNQILSLRMDMQGQIDQPLQMRTLEEVRALQENARTLVILPTHWCGLYRVELPLLSERKAREAIPFALEEQLAQSVTHVHFAFDRAHYHDGKYLVIVIDKQMMTDWMTKLSNLDLPYDQITIDWFALHKGEGCVETNNVLINTNVFQGSLSLDIWEHFERGWAQDVEWHVFADSASLPECAQASRQSGSKYTWMAERLSKAKVINLCQGEFQHATTQTTVLRKYQWAGMLAVAWLLAFIGIHYGLYTMVNQQSQKLDQQIAQAYRVFFPGAQRIISPKARISQLLKQSQSGNNANLWSLLESFSLALAQVKPDVMAKTQAKMASELQSLHYQSPVLTTIFLCDNFSVLEQIESFLRNRKVQVKQISAATEADKVLAKLELSI